MHCKAYMYTQLEATLVGIFDFLAAVVWAKLVIQDLLTAIRQVPKGRLQIYKCWNKLSVQDTVICQINFVCTRIHTYTRLTMCFVCCRPWRMSDILLQLVYEHFHVQSKLLCCYVHKCVSVYRFFIYVVSMSYEKKT